MDKIKIIKSTKSTHDYAAFVADKMCDPEKPYFPKLVEVMEEKVVDDLVDDAITTETSAEFSL